MVFVWGVFVYAKVCFASFAVHGPFTNGPYGWRSLCWVGVLVKGSPPVPSPSPAVVGCFGGEGGMFVVDGVVVGVGGGLEQ